MHDHTITGCVFYAENHYYLTSGKDGLIKVTTETDGKSLVNVLSGHVKPVTSLALHPYDSLLLSSSLDGTVRIWSLETLKEVHRLNLMVPIRKVHFVNCAQPADLGSVSATTTTKQQAPSPSSPSSPPSSSSLEKPPGDGVKHEETAADTDTTTTTTPHEGDGNAAATDSHHQRLASAAAGTTGTGTSAESKSGMFPDKWMLVCETETPDGLVRVFSLHYISKLFTLCRSPVVRMQSCLRLKSINRLGV
jgi:hypothetical protein